MRMNSKEERKSCQKRYLGEYYHKKKNDAVMPEEDAFLYSAVPKHTERAFFLRKQASDAKNVSFQFYVFHCRTFYVHLTRNELYLEARRCYSHCSLSISINLPDCRNEIESLFNFPWQIPSSSALHARAV